MGDQTDSTAPIGRISWQDAMPGMNTPAPEQADTKPLPTLNPADSPYTPLNLPEVTPRQIPIQQETPVDNLGAVSRGGAIAYMADKILRGAMQGYDFAQQRKADQFNKKLAAQQAIYNDQAKQLHDMAVAGVDPNSQEFKDARNRVLTAWQATMQTIGERIPQPKQSKKSKQGQANGQDQSNLLARAMNHQNDPQDALQAVYQGAVLTGPPVFHQIAPYLTPAYQQQQRQKAQGEAATLQAGTTTAQVNAKKAQLENDLLTAEQKGDTEAANRAKTALNDLQEAMTPYHRPTPDELKRQDYDALLVSGQVPKDSNNVPLSYEAWVARESAAGRATGSPKPIKYDPNTKSIFDPATGKTWFGNELNMPTNVAAAFKNANDAAFEKQQKALQLVAARGSAYLAGKVVQVVDPDDPSSTIYKKATDAVRDGDKTVGSIWYKMQMPTAQERGRADLATSARDQLATMEDILKKRSDLFGPVAGRETDFTKWVGSQDPDAQRFAAAARIAADHLAGVFGGRSQAALKAIYDAIGENKTNPAAAEAALEQMNIAAARIQSRGIGTNVPAPNAPPPKGQPTHGVSLKEAMSLPANKGKTEAQVEADIKAHGYEVLP